MFGIAATSPSASPTINCVPAFIIFVSISGLVSVSTICKITSIIVGIRVGKLSAIPLAKETIKSKPSFIISGSISNIPFDKTVITSTAAFAIVGKLSENPCVKLVTISTAMFTKFGNALVNSPIALPTIPPAASIIPEIPFSRKAVVKVETASMAPGKTLPRSPSEIGMNTSPTRAFALSCNVDIRPCVVWLAASIPPANCPVPLVTASIAACSSSTEIAPALMRFCVSSIVSPAA